MRDALKIGLGIFIGIIGVVLCTICTLVALGAGGISILSKAIDTPSPQLTLAAIPPQQLSTTSPETFPQSVGGTVHYSDLSVTLTAYEFSDWYRDENGFMVAPADGAKFLWVHVLVENVGTNADYAPFPSDFAVIFESKQTDPEFIFIDRSGYPSLDGGEIFPGVSKEGWTRFSIPLSAEPNQISIVFKPFEFFSEDYYEWSLAP